MIIEDWVHCPIELGLQNNCLGCNYVLECFDSDCNENEEDEEHEDYFNNGFFNFK